MAVSRALGDRDFKAPDDERLTCQAATLCTRCSLDSSPEKQGWNDLKIDYEIEQSLVLQREGVPAQFEGLPLKQSGTPFSRAMPMIMFRLGQFSKCCSLKQSFV